MEDLPVLDPPFVVLEPVCLAVPEEPVEEPLFVFEPELVESAVFVDGLFVCVAESEAVIHQSRKDWQLLGMHLLLLLFESSFCLTTKASNSGNHRGQGHAAVKVERKSRTSE